MDPEKVAKAHAHLKDALAELKAVNSSFKEPSDAELRTEIFANQHTLFSLLKFEMLAIDGQINQLDAKVNKLK